MKVTLVLALAFAAEAHCGDTPHPGHAAEPVYRYEPAKSRLTGTVKNDRVFYGPPGFGEPPDKKDEERPDRLVLEQPITVEGDKSDELNSPTETGVTELQLVAGLDPKRLEPYRDKRVEITGLLFHAHTAHHFTKVLFAIETIQHAEKPKR